MPTSIPLPSFEHVLMQQQEQKHQHAGGDVVIKNETEEEEVEVEERRQEKEDHNKGRISDGDDDEEEEEKKEEYMETQEIPRIVPQRSPTAASVRPPQPVTSNASLTSPSASNTAAANNNNNNNNNDNNDFMVSSRVNGIGLWRSWQRNFKTPILALYDLFDNAIDASLVTNENDCYFKGKGKIHVSHDNNHDGNKQSTGLCMINNCFTTIPPLSEVMEVFKSTKNKSNANAAAGAGSLESDSLQIGENGVGIKQACASLTDLSIIITRNKNTYNLGLIAASLQQEESCYLPHCVFDTSDGNITKDQMNDVLSKDKDNNPFYNCVFQYGNNNYQRGLQRLYNKCKQLNNRYWGEYDYIFCAVLHNLRHVHGDASSSSSIDEGGINYGGRAKDIMKKLKEELPKHYIHIPNDFNITIDHERVKFQYWERNLVELTEFNFIVDPENYWFTSDDWLDPQQGQYLRMYCGFDPKRVQDKNQSTCGSLYVYSRHSGRLIRHYVDARTLLKLTAGGTDFSQGLTIIIDDFLGTIPLNPTKQDYAFGQEKNGDIHEKNLFDWVSCFTKIYYLHHKKQFGDRKTLLTDHVMKGLKAIEKLQHYNGDDSDDDSDDDSGGRGRSNNTKIKSLMKGEFTTFVDITFLKRTDRNVNSIRTRGRINTQVGPDTYIHLKPPKKLPKAFNQKKKAAASSPVALSNAALAEAAALGKRKSDPVYYEEKSDDNSDNGEYDPEKHHFINRNKDWFVPTEQAAAEMASSSRKRARNNGEAPPESPELYSSLKAKNLLLESQLKRIKDNETKLEEQVQNERQHKTKAACVITLLEKRINERDKEIEDLKKVAMSNSNVIEDKDVTIKERDKSIGELTSELHRYAAILRERNTHIEQLEKEASLLKADETGTTAKQQGDSEELLNTMKEKDALIKENNDRIEQLQNDLELSDALKETYENENAKLKGIIAKFRKPNK